MDDVFDSISAGNTKMPALSRKKDGFSRVDVVNAFQNAFELIGGTTRLALWANAHPDKFFPLYAKLLPATTINLGEGQNITIIHRIGPTALDQHGQEVIECQPLSSPTTPGGTSETSTVVHSVGPSSSPTDELEKP